MKQKMKQWIAYILSFCMIFSMTQFVSGSAVYAAEVADGEIDESQEGIQIVRYMTGKETSSTSASYLESYADRLTDFIVGTESMTWSVEFKTSSSKLQSLLFLERGDQYCAFYLNGGALKFEPTKNNISVQGNVSYADNQYHTAELEIQKGKAVILRMDGQEVARNTSPMMLKDLTWTPTAFTIGGSKNYSSASGWKFEGSMKNVVLKKTYVVQKKPVWQGSNLSDAAIDIEGCSGLENGAISMAYRLKEESNVKTTLMEFGSNGEIYADPTSGKVGTSIGSTTLEKAAGTALGTTKWHNVTLVKSDSQLEIYVDGSSIGSGEYSGNLDLSKIQKGENVYCSGAKVYDSAMNEDQVSVLHENTNLTTYPDRSAKLEGYFKGPDRDIFNEGFDGAKSYRIPAITTSYRTGTVIASIDKRVDSSADGAVTDTVIRRSEDNGETWGDPIMVIDMPDYQAYTTDPEMVTDNDPESPTYGRIYILVDHFPKGISWNGAEVGTGYKEIDGKKYQILTDKNGDEYTIREKGIVYDSEGNLTEYQVETEAEAPYKDQGNLYKNGEKVGSIYDFKSKELKMLKTCYLWITYSDDDGLTWSRPRDITPEVKEDWMSFSGTGPGAGVQLQSGRLIFTTYLNRDGNAGHFSSCNVYTDDHGETWHKGGSPNDNQPGGPAQCAFQLNESCIVELKNGHLIQFMKNASSEVAMSVSTDQGEHWGPVTYAKGIPEVYCQMAVLHYGDLYDPDDKQIKDAIIFANPAGPGRTHGTVRIAFVNDDDTLDWKYSKLIEEERFLYNSLTRMKNGNIGMIYENEKGGATAAAFTSFSAQYIMDPNEYESTPQPSRMSVKVLDASGNETETLSIGNELRIDIAFDNLVFAAGNVTSNIQIGNEVKEASLVGNIDENTLEFSYTIQPEDTGDITAFSEVNVKEGGAAETIYNIPLADKPYVTKTVSLGKVQEAQPVQPVQPEGFEQLPTAGMTATAGSEHSSTGNEGPASNVLNDNRGQIWHTKYDDDNASNGGRSKHYITIDLNGTYLVCGLTYLPRDNAANNGTITKYQIEVSLDGESFYPYARGEWAKNKDEKLAIFAYGPVPAAYVRLRALETGDEWATASAIRIIGNSQTEGVVNRAELAQYLIQYSEDREPLAEVYPQFVQNLAAAEEVALDTSATQAQIDSIVKTLSASLTALDNDLNEEKTAAEEKSKDDYTITSWIEYQKAVTAAEELVDDAPQAQKLAVYLALKQATANLIVTDAAMEAAKEAAETKTGKAIEKLEAVIQEKNNSISAGDTIPLKLEDGTKLQWSTDFEYVTIDPYGNVIVSEDLEEERDIEFIVAVSYSKGKIVTESKSVKVKPLERYTVTFDVDGGAPSPDKQTILTGKTASKPNDPSKAGYTFTGWYLGSAATPYDFDTPVTGSITLSAKWKAIDGDGNGDGNGNVVVVTPRLTKGLTATVGKFKYVVLDPDKKTAAVTGSTSNSEKSLTIGDNVTINGESCTIVQIDQDAFKNYKKLTKVTIGKNVETIEKNAFSGCKKLKKITLKGAALKTVKSGAFKKTAKNLTVKASKVKKPQRKKLQTAMRKGGNKKLTVK